MNQPALTITFGQEPPFAIANSQAVPPVPGAVLCASASLLYDAVAHAPTLAPAQATADSAFNVTLEFSNPLAMSAEDSVDFVLAGFTGADTALRQLQTPAVDGSGAWIFTPSTAASAAAQSTWTSATQSLRLVILSPVPAGTTVRVTTMLELPATGLSNAHTKLTIGYARAAIVHLPLRALPPEPRLADQRTRAHQQVHKQRVPTPQHIAL